jgi:hypothetical protein
MEESWHKKRKGSWDRLLQVSSHNSSQSMRFGRALPVGHNASTCPRPWAPRGAQAHHKCLILGLCSTTDVVPPPLIGTPQERTTVRCWPPWLSAGAVVDSPTIILTTTPMAIISATGSGNDIEITPSPRASASSPPPYYSSLSRSPFPSSSRSISSNSTDIRHRRSRTRALAPNYALASGDFA